MALEHYVFKEHHLHNEQTNMRLCVGRHCSWQTCVFSVVTVGSPSRGGDVAVYDFDINQPNFASPF